MCQQRLIQLLVLTARVLIRRLSRLQLLLPVTTRLLPAVIVRLFLRVQHTVLVLQSLALLLILRQRRLPQLRHQRCQLLQIAVVRLLPRALGVAGGIPAGQGRRLAQRVLHGRRAAGGIQSGIPLVRLVLLRIVVKGLPPRDLVIQRLQTLLEPGPVRLRFQRRHAVPVGLRRRHLVRWRIAPLQLLQTPRRARRDLRPGCRRLCCRSGLRRLLRRRRRGQQAPPRLVAGNAVHHRQSVLLLIVPYRGSRLLAEDTILVQTIPPLVQFILQLPHRAAL